jgi:sugar O-acyltransferase (sialic acid O-acetyltransferase NeuD family)
MAKTKLFVYGASGHGKVVADIARLDGYDFSGFIDDDPDADAVSFEILSRDHPGVCTALGIGSNPAREHIYRKLKASGFTVATLIHPGAHVAQSARIGEGSVVMAGAVINPDALIERGAIINSGAIVEHDNVIDQFAHVSPGVSLAGEVSVGSFAHVGIGSSVIQGIRIGAHAVVGAGSVVIRDVDDHTTVAGVPAKVIRHG